MAQRPVGVADRPAGAAVAEFRTRERSVGSTVDEQYVIFEKARRPEGAYRRPPQRMGFSSFRTVGVASANWVPLIVGGYSLTSWGGGPDNPVVALRELRVQIDHTVAVAAPRVVALSRCNASAITGGQQLPCVPFDSTVPGSINGDSWAVYGATASDGGAAATIGGLASLTPFKRGVQRRPHTATGMLYSEQIDLHTPHDEPFLLASPSSGFTESLAIQFIDALVVTDFVLITGVLEQYVP